MASLTLALTGAALTTSPLVLLKQYCALVLGSAFGPEFNPEEFNPEEFNTVASLAYNVDIKFANLSAENGVVVNRINNLLTQELIGGGWIRNHDFYNIHIYCYGHSAPNNCYNISQVLQSGIGANLLALQDDGIDEIILTGFDDIAVYKGTLISKGIAPSKPTTVARTKLTVELIYDQLAS